MDTEQEIASPGKRVELLAPAGDFEKLEVAVHYGADAVYLAHKEFSLRNFSGNFTLAEMERAVHFAHGYGVKVYVACNIYARNAEQSLINQYLKKLGKIEPDGIIVADPGIILACLEIIPHIPIHLSTQANTTNAGAVRFWEKMGIRRVNMARELSLMEIQEIAAQSRVEIEAFAHGAMCISYSGRCLLSTYLTGRDSNRGCCTHPCRWNYAVMEETRPGQYMPIAEDERGTYIFNSRDLSMIEHIPQMVAAGIHALKIEGRMKGIHYLSTVINVYRQALDTYMAAPDGYGVAPHWLEELNRISNREYCTGFYFQDPKEIRPNAANRLVTSNRRFVAKIIGRKGNGLTEIEVRNKILPKDVVEIVHKGAPSKPDRIETIIHPHFGVVEFAQPGSRVEVALTGQYDSMDLMRRIEGGA